MVVENKAYRESADGTRYPMFFRGAALRQPAPSAKKEEQQDSASVSESAEEGGTPSRPRRNRARPQNFINYRQENEAGMPGNPMEPLSPEDSEDPYEDLVFWTKCYNHPYWPSIKCSEEEIRVLKENDGVDFEKESIKAGGAEVTAVLFLGSNSKGIVKSAEMLPYSENFDVHSRKKSSLQFRLGLEKADELVLQKRAARKNETTCNVCNKEVADAPPSDDALMEVETPPPQAGTDNRMTCARCLTPAHAKCVEKAGSLANPFGNDLDPVWFCALCTRQAPTTVRSRTDQEARALKRAHKRKSQRSSDAPRRTRATTPPPASAERRNGNGVALELLGGAGRGGGGSSSSVRGSANNTPRSTGGARDLMSSNANGGTASGSALKRKDATNQDAHEDSCFICGDGGVLLMCDFPSCPKSYHKYCLRGLEGHDEEDEDEDAPEKTWHCPWHTCAVCAVGEHQATQQHHLQKNTASSSSASSTSSVGSANGSGTHNLGRKRTALPPPPALGSIKVPTIMEKDSSNSSALPARLERTGSDIVEGFVRCASCPTSLCTKHMRAPRPVFDGKKHGVPRAISRPAKRGYFKCVHCVGGASDGATSSHVPSPLVQLAQLLHRVWSRAVNSHDRICKIFLEEMDVTHVPQAGRRVLNEAIARGGVRTMLDVRDKVWRLEYRDWASFNTDVNTISGLVRTVYGGSSPLIKETARTLPLLVTQAHAAVARQVSEAEERIAELQEIPGPAFDNKSFATGGLFPSVVMAGQQSGQARAVGKRRSIDEWERYLENSSFAASKELRDPGARPAREEAHGIAAALLAAAQSHSGFNDHLPPSRQTLDEMLENQSMVLRSALRGTAMLRDAVSRTLEGFASTELSSDGIVTLGEMRLAAEYRMVNRNLRAKNANLTTMLSIERTAREQLEKRVQELEAQLGQSTTGTLKRPALEVAIGNDDGDNKANEDVSIEQKDNNAEGEGEIQQAQGRQQRRLRNSPAAKKARVSA
ncbi:Histone-lysine N-methyltransferase NSD3 [Hondaea fermentalgiana]|uniref:Histone-lysine N-methyltransferase NSD3 n=1 Tax=Hondaea fermentalgiana TaxID=2315210 RepID=A0A2R5GPC8_9STRA|nr:Histone-lysine N-methyltransferase NSD3 [Hondaea fermentalgiana]|eukprot:GBG32159.1 Histone-lysine N-methyltransferase NSD3 [Hondaea fermentalgiana]